MVDTRPSLLIRVRNRDDSASWQEFFTLYEPLLMAYVRRLGVQEHDARDIVQTLLLKLSQKLPEFELDKSRGRFRSWLGTLVHSAVVDWARRRKRDARIEEAAREQVDAVEQQAAAEPGDEWNTAYRQRIMAAVMADVKERSQANTWACFEEHVLKNRPAKDVAAELDLAPTAVYQNASRVLRRIREQCLAEYDEGIDDV